MSSSAQQYADNGVVLSKASLAVGDEIVISYSGLLAGSGADQVFAHVGYGENWDNKVFILMENEGGVFKAAYKVLLPGILNISFKDSANNWDNNSSENYSFEISGKEKKTASKKVADESSKAAEKTETKKPAARSATVKKAEPKEKAGAEKGTAKATTKTAAKKIADEPAKVKKSAAKEKAPAKKKEK